LKKLSYASLQRSIVLHASLERNSDAYEIHPRVREHVLNMRHCFTRGCISNAFRNSDAYEIHPRFLRDPRILADTRACISYASLQRNIEVTVNRKRGCFVAHRSASLHTGRKKRLLRCTQDGWSNEKKTLKLAARAAKRAKTLVLFYCCFISASLLIYCCITAPNCREFYRCY
jgi:hypothetical protein